MAAQMEAAFGALHLAHGLIGRGHQHVRVLAPDFLLGALVEQGELERMATEHAIDPAGRHAALREQLLDLEEHARMHLEPAVAPGLQHPEEPRLDHLRHRLGRNVAARNAPPRPLLQHRNHPTRTLDQVHLGGHGSPPHLIFRQNWHDVLPAASTGVSGDFKTRSKFKSVIRKTSIENCNISR